MGNWLKGKSLVLLIVILGLGSVAFDVGSAVMSRIGDGLFIGAMFLVFYIFTLHKNKKFDELRDANALMQLEIRTKDRAVVELNRTINSLQSKTSMPMPLAAPLLSEPPKETGGSIANIFGRKKGI